MRGIFWLIVLVAFGVGMWMIASTISVVPGKKICFLGDNDGPNTCVWVKVAAIDSEQVRGLSGKWFMPEQVGMLFVYDESQFLSFWMKEMRFGLDFVWLRDGEVVDITENVGRPRTIEAERLVIEPKVPADAVLEVNSGWVERRGVAIGDILKPDD